MNKIGIVGVSLVAALSMGGGMLLTGSASASSANDIGTVEADPGAATSACVHTDSAESAIADGAIAIDGVDGPISSFEMDPGSTWHSVSVDADGNITHEQGIGAELPDPRGAGTSHTAIAYSDVADGSGMVSIPEADIQVGGTCNPLLDSESSGG